ncbi:MAG: nuclear transport factor 2 family protein [Nitrospira defluvii]|nr:nuclear transport factor 2 family protein [Nitrospira defluvii]
MNEQQAISLAQAWITAWNRHDLDAIEQHYASNVEFTSPFVRALVGESSGTIHGREPLRAYFQKGLQAYPDLHFELVRTLTGIDNMLLYDRSVNGLLAAEMMTINEEGQIETVRVHYVKE